MSVRGFLPIATPSAFGTEAAAEREWGWGFPKAGDSPGNRTQFHARKFFAAQTI